MKKKIDKRIVNEKKFDHGVEISKEPSINL